MAYQGTSPAAGGSLSQLLRVEYEDIFYDDYKRREQQYLKVAKIQNIDTRYWKEGSLATFGAHRVLREGQGITRDVVIQGPEKEITVTGYALGFEHTRSMVRDDTKGLLKRAPSELGKSANYTIDLLYWDTFNSGFGTTQRTGLDGYALFYASHPLIGGGTQSNLGTASALIESALEAGLLHFKKIKNERGITVAGAFMPYLLIIPPELEMQAKRLLLSPYRPGTMDNDINVFKDMRIQYYVVDFLSSTTAWFLAAQNHDSRLVWRDPVEFDSGDDPKTKNAFFDSTFRLAVEFYDYKGLWGNAGL